MTEPHAAPFDHHVPWSICPHCGALQDGAANMTNTDAPEEGDVSMCFECGGWAVFEADGSRVVMPADHEAWGDPDIQKTIAVYRLMRSQHPERWPDG